MTDEQLNFKVDPDGYRLINKAIKKYINNEVMDLKSDELFEEGLIGLSQAMVAPSFDPSKSKFTTFAYSSICKNIYQYLQFKNKKKRKGEMNKLYLDCPLYESYDDGEETTLGELIGTPFVDHEIEYNEHDRYSMVKKEFLEALKNTLSYGDDYEIAKYLMDKKARSGYKDLAKKLNKDEKVVQKRASYLKNKILKSSEFKNLLNEWGIIMK